MTGPKHRPQELLAETRRTLPIALLRAREHVMDRIRPKLSAHNITEQQWRVLRVLQEVTTTDATKLAQSACILGPSLTRILRALEGRELITVVRDPQDGRRSIIELSRTGTDFIAAISPEIQATNAEIEARLGKKRIEALLDELESLLDDLAPER